MAKRVYFVADSTPDQPGWNDRVEVWEGDKRLWVGRGSINPSYVAFKEYDEAKDAGLNPKPEDYTWDKKGGIIDYGTYGFKTDNFLNGSLAVNERGYIPSQKPNPRHDNKPVMDEVFVHVGDYGKKPHENRRSLGCPTIHPEDYAAFAICSILMENTEKLES